MLMCLFIILFKAYIDKLICSCFLITDYDDVGEEPGKQGGTL